MRTEIFVPDGKSGEWAVETFEVTGNEFSQFKSMWEYGRGCLQAGTYKRLRRGKILVMSNTPDECDDFSHFVSKAQGSILLNGLGLGVVLQALINKEEVKEITVIENSEDVIKLSGPTYTKDPKVTIIQADAFEYQPPKEKRYNAVWHDIWDSICSDNIEEMKKLHRKYGRKTDYQESWCRGRCERERREYERNKWYW